MSAAEDMAPETARSLRGAEIRESVPSVAVSSAPSAMPLTSRHVSVRVDRRLRNTKAHMMPKNERLVLRTLAGHADAADKCYPSVPTLADECGMAAATARAALHALIAKGWLFISDAERLDATGARTSNEYTLTPERGEWWPDNAREHLARPAPRARRTSEPPANGDTAPVSSGDTTSDGDTGVVSSGETRAPQAAQPPWYQAAREEEPNEEPMEAPNEAPIACAPAGAPAREATPLVLFRDLEPPVSPPPPPAKPKRAKREKPTGEHPMPDDWQPSDAHRAYAAKHGLRLDFEVDAFRGWAVGRKALSWDGTFTTRLSNQAKWNADKAAGAPKVGMAALPYGRGSPAPDRRQPGGWAKEDPEAWKDFDREQEGAEQ